jgi:hypothetical protein
MSETEQENPQFSCMITGFKVERQKDAVPYYALKSYSLNNGPI